MQHYELTNCFIICSDAPTAISRFMFSCPDAEIYAKVPKTFFLFVKIPIFVQLRFRRTKKNGNKTNVHAGYERFGSRKGRKGCFFVCTYDVKNKH